MIFGMKFPSSDVAGSLRYPWKRLNTCPCSKFQFPSQVLFEEFMQKNDNFRKIVFLLLKVFQPNFANYPFLGHIFETRILLEYHPGEPLVQEQSNQIGIFMVHIPKAVGCCLVTLKTHRIQR